jgi:FixJ family two-component response regulator
MPGMDGLELQNRLISNNCQIPIVFLTAHNDEHARARALKAGAISFLCKPFNEESLICDVKKAVNQHRLNAR